MILPKEVLAEHLENIIRENYTSDAKKTKEIYKKVKKQYSMPLDKAKDIMTLNIALIDCSDFELFCIATAIMDDGDYGDINKYFTKDEIRRYSKEKYHEEIENPYIISGVVKIRDGQYMSHMDAAEFRRLDNSAMINYNENTQRVMKRVRNGNEEFFKIAINRKAVKEIKALMSINAYFPDPITLNIPQEDTDISVEYDEENFKLIIHNLKHFDILDGYHRFIAMRELIEENPDFNYTMELRISEWTESQGQQFIFQQDQKTKMNKSDSKSFNQYSLSNRIVERLNTSMYLIAGKIGRKDCQIMASDLSDVIEKVFTKGVDPQGSDGRKMLANLPKEIGKYTDLLYEDEEFGSKNTLTYKELFVIMYMIYKSVNQEVFVGTEKRISNELDKIKIVPSVKPNKKVLDQLDQMISA